ncbi:DNA topoisomerase IB [Horticoccus luteus]|uniref:DNA topoisomerase IB n=1 Tax=Horticoccus luteus TaxID=2862869 RepID=A0A8F9XMC9_9BACT|nr:DNA topoisomerase IB [Horticoccus luteus]QYM79914.1 DNA topoisomerase IB [Horticoccus luteus]
MARRIRPPATPPARRRAPPPHPANEAILAAREAGLRYVADTRPGLSRRRAGRSFAYRDAAGRPIHDTATLARIKHLAIPPAWRDVWICASPHGHIQATGRDMRGRKQYRYHPDWRAVRDETKYERVIAFGRALPAIRRRVARDLRLPGLGRRKVLAAMVRLLETTLIRIGNDEYARENRSFGLSTMQDRHAKIKGGLIHFEFRGKSGRQHQIDLREPRLAKIVRQAQDLPGQELFQYRDDAGAVQDVASDDVNAYLREIAGDDFSAKDFRTWAGTVIAALALREFERFDTKAQAKKNLVRAIERVAERLGNTPAVCRKCYIHPVVMESYLDGATVKQLEQRTEAALRGGLRGLTAEEGAVLAFLQARLAAPPRAPARRATRRTR